ncbi:MAG: serine hydrolase [bacterium]
MKKLLFFLAMALFLSPATVISKAADYSSRLEKIIAGEARLFPGTPGIFFLDLKAGKKIKVNAEVSFPAASLIKVPILIEVFKEAREGRIRLDRKLTVTRKDQVGGSGILKSATPGSKITVLKAATLMIQESDNTATDMLIRLVGMEAVNGTMEKIGCRRTFLKRTIWDFDAADRGRDNVTSPQDMALMLASIENASFLDKDSCLAMKNILLGQKRRNLMTARLPKDLPVAHKTGGLSGILHDCGIIYVPGRPCILCLLGKDIRDAEKAQESWRRISQEIYLEMKKQGP